MRPRFPRGRRPDDRRGAAIVEFAFVVPILLMFIFGVLEFSRMVYVRHILHNAAREGARYAACHSAPVTIDGATATNQEDWIRDNVVRPRLFGLNIPNSDIRIYLAGDDGTELGSHRAAEFGDLVVCEIDLNYRMLYPVFDSHRMYIRSVMRSESS